MFVLIEHIVDAHLHLAITCWVYMSKACSNHFTTSVHQIKLYSYKLSGIKLNWSKRWPNKSQKLECNKLGDFWVVYAFVALNSQDWRKTYNVHIYNIDWSCWLWVLFWGDPTDIIFVFESLAQELRSLSQLFILYWHHEHLEKLRHLIRIKCSGEANWQRKQTDRKADFLDSEGAVSE